MPDHRPPTPQRRAGAVCLQIATAGGWMSLVMAWIIGPDNMSIDEPAVHALIASFAIWVWLLVTGFVILAVSRR